MLSSLSSFLPSRLHGTAFKDPPRSTINPVEDQSDYEDGPEAPVISPQAGDKPAKVKDRDGKGPSEVFLLFYVSAGRVDSFRRNLKRPFRI